MKVKIENGKMKLNSTTEFKGKTIKIVKKGDDYFWSIISHGQVAFESNQEQKSENRALEIAKKYIREHY